MKRITISSARLIKWLAVYTGILIPVVTLLNVFSDDPLAPDAPFQKTITLRVGQILAGCIDNDDVAGLDAFHDEIISVFGYSHLKTRFRQKFLVNMGPKRAGFLYNR